MRNYIHIKLCMRHILFKMASDIKLRDTVEKAYGPDVASMSLAEYITRLDIAEETAKDFILGMEGFHTTRSFNHRDETGSAGLESVYLSVNISNGHGVDDRVIQIDFFATPMHVTALDNDYVGKASMLRARLEEKLAGK